MIEGMVLADPDSLERVDGTTVVKRKDAPIRDKVGIVSGGGSGHEPAHAGYIGKGMLDAAVLGEIFTSPSVDQVFEGVKAVASEVGVFLFIKNYKEIVLNFVIDAYLFEAEEVEL